MSGRSSWHTTIVGIKASILLTINLVCTGISGIRISAMFDSLGRGERMKFFLVMFDFLLVTLMVHGVAGMPNIFTMSKLELMYSSCQEGLIASSSKFVKNKYMKLYSGMWSSIVVLFCVWLQFVTLTFDQGKTDLMVSTLEMAIQSFCMAEMFRLCSLYYECLVLDTGYFKFVMAACICTQYYKDGGIITPRFWVVLSTCASLTFLYGNYFLPCWDASTAQSECEPLEHHHVESATDDKDQPAPPQPWLSELAEYVLSFHISLHSDSLPPNPISRV